ncbi:hypothetical protein GIB67_014940 [Kingdonia uniflora]|uniref:galactinol--sucrose galactosyltransferase n=1 Tax=Kingdonia uniflora TaxID=39325 RepID=A0A7J7MTD3_9MAGN|nr:hypothetical protein GIB67_014940 [Kingdonia uniflora]
MPSFSALTQDSSVVFGWNEDFALTASWQYFVDNPPLRHLNFNQLWNKIYVQFRMHTELRYPHGDLCNMWNVIKAKCDEFHEIWMSIDIRVRGVLLVYILREAKDECVIDMSDAVWKLGNTLLQVMYWGVGLPLAYALCFERNWENFQRKEEEMTITPIVRISEKKLVVRDRTVLMDVPDNIISTPVASSGPEDGIFVGAVFDESKSRHVVSLGTLRDIRFLACFRFKLWWITQKMGDQGREIPLETQFLLLETKGVSQHKSDDGYEDHKVMYVVFLPLIEGPFRACLQGNLRDELELCFESGDTETKSSLFTHSLFINVGTDPFKTITDAVRTVELHLKSFRQRHEKKIPGIVDYFGWCTWDAFYQEVNQEGVEAGLKSLSEGGTPPKFVIIDDGWQSVKGGSQVQKEKLQQPLRLTGVRENAKFRNKEDPMVGIESIVSIAKEKYGLKYVYVWHAITGYWGGVHPDVDPYMSKVRYSKVSKGVMENEPGWKFDPLAVQGVGLVPPENVFKFYDELHGYLFKTGVDGVKVDVQCVLETLGAELGGRVELSRMYHQALDASISKNFADNGIIACMSHGTDALYCSKQTAVVRASDDFYPQDPLSHTIHIASVSYNSIFLGEFMLPDWDMFHSLHPAAEYHASARAISGGPIYVSDAPGKHDFELLRKLVLPDGSVLRARLPARPTQDSLFSDPSRDGISLLKIWNMNKYTGVLGVYNCQGAAWSTIEKKNTFHITGKEPLAGTVRSHDVHLIAEATSNPTWDGNCAIYCHKTGKLVTLLPNASIHVLLEILNYDVFTVSPIRKMSSEIEFAPLGLIDMFNAGGAIQELRYEGNGSVQMEVKGCGRFGSYSSSKPTRCTVSSASVQVSYNPLCGLLTLDLDRMPEESQLHTIDVEF